MKNLNVKGLKALLASVLLSLCFVSQSSMAGAASACANVAEVSDDVTRSTCFQFVTGFLEGALLSDQQIMTNLNSDKELTDFTKRAIRTRLGEPKGPVPSTLLADFCLPEEAASDEVVLNILDALKQVEDKQTISSAMIYHIIKREYPC